MSDHPKITYLFEEGSNPLELASKGRRLSQQGWQPVGEPRPLEVRFPSGKSAFRYSQTFARGLNASAQVPAGDNLLCSMDGKGSNNVFWGEIAPCEHCLQLYPNEEIFLRTLVQFVAAGIQSGECTVVIATRSHRKALEALLAGDGISVAKMTRLGRFISLDAAETLAKFMVNGWPDEQRFERMVLELVDRARLQNRRLRAFGEMVALLWARGECGATVRLEHLWHALCHREEFSLFCAYPRSGFTADAADSVREICAAHSRMIG